MPSRALEEILRRIDQDPEDPGLLVEARGLLRRVDPADGATRARLCAAALRLAPAGQSACGGDGYGEPLSEVLGGSVRLSPDGRVLFVGRNRWDDVPAETTGFLMCTVRSWRLTDRAPVLSDEVQQTRRGAGLKLVFSHDGRAALLCHLMESTAGYPLYDLEAETREIAWNHELSLPWITAAALARAPGEPLTLALSDGELIRITTRASIDQRRPRISFPAAAAALALDPEGRRLAWVADDGQVEIRALPTGEVLHRLRAHAEMTSLRWAPGDRLLGLGHGGLWVAEADGSRTRNLIGVGGEPFALALEPRGRIAFAAAARGRLHIWDLEAGALLADIRGLEGLADVGLDEERGVLTAAFEDRSLRMWSW